MLATLPSKWSFSALCLAAILLAGCGVTTKKTFLDEPVQETVGNAVPVSDSGSEQGSPQQLSQNPALNQGEKTGVQKLMNILTPYRINIQQGNFVSQEMLTRVQQGMTKEQVRFALGTPLLTDVFHDGRWDYIFRLQKPSGEITNNRVIVYFEDNRVTRIVNDPLPNETQYLDTVAGPAPKKKADPGEDTTKTGLVSSEEASADSLGDAAIADTPVMQEEHSTSEQTADAKPVEETVPAVETTESRETSSLVSDEDPEMVSPAITSPAVPAEPVYSRQAITKTPDTESYPADTGESISNEREVKQDSAPAYQYESEPVTAEKTEAASASIPAETDSKPVYTPQPVRQETYQKATTIQDVSAEEEEDFKAAPNSTMQLHDLMQPQ